MKDKKVLGKITIFCGGLKREYNALFDTGAEHSFMSQDIANQLEGCIIIPNDKITDIIKSPIKNAEMKVDEVLLTSIEKDGVTSDFNTFMISHELNPKTLIIGRREMDNLRIKFTKNGPVANEADSPMLNGLY